MSKSKKSAKSKSKRSAKKAIRKSAPRKAKAPKFALSTTAVDPRLPAIGKLHERLYHGKTHKWSVADATGAIKLDGKVYPSLTAAAMHLTAGSKGRVSGFVFFGLVDRSGSGKDLQTTKAKGKAPKAHANAKGKSKGKAKASKRAPKAKAKAKSSAKSKAAKSKAKAGESTEVASSHSPRSGNALMEHDATDVAPNTEA